ncbi:MAG: FAD-dependent oxidoreductase [Deltaproteobacteria bacterium]|nr:FAD-dependent oxidoreductase [Deltaproteobacteria bacterium]
MREYRTRSFWLETGEYGENPPLAGDVETDVAIVGGGFTGLMTAYFLKKLEPSLGVALLEGDVIGFGASGRNAGFSMTLFGFTMSLTALRFGRQKALEAHLYMEKAVDFVRDFVKEHAIDCDYEHPGFLRAATSKRYENRIRHEIDFAHSLGVRGIEWLENDVLAREVRSPLYFGAWWEPRCGILNPARLVRAEKKIVESAGVKVYERTPVSGIKRNGRISLRTEGGSVAAAKVVLATNAYSHLIPGLKRKQVPVFTHIVLSEPLAKTHFDEIGWRNRQGIEDARNLVHYYRLTADNRLLMGGRSVSVAWGRDMERDVNEKTFAGLERDARRTFPVLKDIRFTHRWGGPVSVPVDMTPAIGTLGDERIVYSLGCVGHGVSLSHLNGRTLAEMILGRKTERTEVFFVNRRTIPWPPEPIRFVLSKAIKGTLDLQDRICD